MWTLRILNGSQKGSCYPLHSGINQVGRSSSCTIVIDSPGISRVHTEVEIKDDQITIVDKQSSNGTFINGVKIKKQIFRLGDQISAHNITFDIIRSGALQANMHSSLSLKVPSQINEQPSPDFVSAEAPANAAMSQKKITLLSRWNQYVERVILPGVYKLPEWIELRWAIGLFVVAFIFLVTILSTIPMAKILSHSTEKESMNHAESIALALLKENQSALNNHLKAGVSVDYALRRPGVKKALIINASDGRIIAPLNRMHEYPEEPFIHRARKFNTRTIEKINSSTMAAMIPIQLFNPETGTQSVTAYSVVFYNMKSIAIDNKQVISLLVQSLFIAVLVGLLLFFFLQRMIAFPIESMNEQLGQALRDPNKNVSTRYQFESLQQLCSNINSALERLSQSHESNQQANLPLVDKQQEMSNLVEMIGFACLCVKLESQSVIAVNTQFEQQIEIPSHSLLHQPIDQIGDVSLQLNIKELIEQVKHNPSQMQEDQLEFNSRLFHITAQGIYGTSELEYILFVFSEHLEESA